MRTIKFRAWYKPLKKMIEPDRLEHINFEVKVLGVYIKMEDRGFHKLRMSDFELMQFTGLKDRNGKEIYEGDIVTWFINDTTYTAPVYYDTDQASFWMGKDASNRCGLVLNDWMRGEYEIIGNIHQNPELLEV